MNINMWEDIPDGKLIALMIGPRVPKSFRVAARKEWDRRKNKEVQELAEEASDDRWTEEVGRGEP